ncbi:TadE/TadG family type IV pilus assembly protein [Kitasatospora sp. NPDC093558]|uniref:TadE/TadG family type IV pilus assembly protein n=1 Tax=Kitasatospora sp. NPDC093558 TaxID=3155201 RepID=UPI00343C9FDC
MSLSLAIVFPVVLLLLLLVVQASLWWYARQVALTAAREGAEAGRTQHAVGDAAKGGASKNDPAKDQAARDAAARERAEEFLHRQGSGSYQVSTDGSTAQRVRVTVQLTPTLLIPGLSAPHITQFAEAPRERFVPPGGVP